MKIELKKRIVYAGDVLIALLKAGWSIREAADFVNAIPSVPVTTNADKIRDMSDEELTEFFRPENGGKSPWCEPIGRTRCGKGPCKKCMLKWLKAPAEEMGGADNGQV